MRGDPLHFCAKDHPPFFFTGENCPYCELVAANEKQAEQIRLLQTQLAEASRA